MSKRAIKSALTDAISTRERWEAELRTAEETLSDLESRAVDLSDVEGAFRLAADRATAKERARVCRDAVEGARAAELQARRAVVEAEADSLEPLIAAASKALEDFHETTQKLLAPLVAHTGREWREIDPFLDARQAGVVGTLTFPLAKVTALTANLRRLKDRERALRLAAAGADPTLALPVEQLPECLLEGGVLPYSVAAA